MARKTIAYQGRPVEGEVVSFDVKAEPWCEYQCADGTKVKVKVFVAEIVRLDGEYTPDGDPVYSVKTQAVITTEVPDHLRAKPSGSSKPGSYL